MIVNKIIEKAKYLKGCYHNWILKLKGRMNWFDISDNLNTSDCVDKELLYDSIDSPNKEHMVRYVPTDLKQLKIILDQLISIDKTLLDNTLVDFGCGKGRVMIMAERMGFKKVIGIEFSKMLYDICCSNLKKANSSSVEAVHSDATEYQLSGDMRTFYFCNPFEYCLLEKVLDNIKNVLRQTSQDGYIVYIDPRKFGRLDPNEFELLVKYDGHPGSPYHIYKVIV